MFNLISRSLISRSVDYSLHSLLGFDIHKAPLEPFAQMEPSLTLLSELYTTGEALLALSKDNKSEADKGSSASIETIAQDVEKVLYSNNYHVKVSSIKIHTIDKKLKECISQNKLNILNNKHVFLEKPSSETSFDLYDPIFQIQLKNLVPVLNFPEKDPYYNSNNKHLSTLKDRGCVFHIDLLSLSGCNGAEAKKTACSLLQSNLVHFVSFQLQQLEELKKNKGIRISNKIAKLLDEQLFISLP